MVFILFISFVVLLRFAELIHSKRNEKWLLANGAFEYGQKHYPYIVLLHILFFLSLITEYAVKQIATYSILLMIFFFLILGVKIYVVFTLGKFWNTKIYHIPDTPVIRKGFYLYFKHPNYMIVIIEIALIPCIFQLYITAIIFSILNSVMLFIRIKEENKVLMMR